MIKNKNRGFTLIELLVVIAIIGILASVVLISTSQTRKNGNDAAIKANLGTIKLQAELVNIQYGCFSDDCDTPVETPCTLDDIAIKAFAAATKASGNGADAACNVSADASDFAVSVPLSTDPALIWCVDSSGYAEAGTLAATDGVCA